MNGHESLKLGLTIPVVQSPLLIPHPIAAEKYYKLVPPEEVTKTDLEADRQQTPDS